MDPRDTPDEGPDSSPASPSSSQASTPQEQHDENPKRLPSLRSVSDPQNMNPNSTPLGTLSNARRPPPPPSSVMGGGALSGSDAMLKARTLAQARSLGKSPASGSPAGGSPGRSSPAGGFPGGFPGNVRLPPSAVRPSLQNSASAPSVPKPQGLSARRGMKLSMNDMAPPPAPAGQGKPGAGRGPDGAQANGSINVSRMDDFKKYIDAEKGWLTFEGAATITSRGVDFEGGRSFHMSLDDVAPLEILGKGNYGTVHKVRHARAPPRFGPGLSQYKGPRGPGGTAEGGADGAEKGIVPENGNYSGVVMAMKEIRLELDEAKFTTILKELVILHECVSPYIIDFYGAFFQEGAVYMCIEYMDGGSVDKLYAGGVPEDVLRRIVYATVNGLKTLKEDHNIIHRDVKPTNILVNTRGQVKICDFGVSGNLVASIAKTNIGCQSYMAPERISGGAMATGADGTYSVQSDIWSLGLTAIECALGKYPYPPEAASTIFSQLSVSPPSSLRSFSPLLPVLPIFMTQEGPTNTPPRPSSTANRRTSPRRATPRRPASSSAAA